MKVPTLPSYYSNGSLGLNIVLSLTIEVQFIYLFNSLKMDMSSMRGSFPIQSGRSIKKIPIEKKKLNLESTHWFFNA
jgi:hypothetical protein